MQLGAWEYVSHVQEAREYVTRVTVIGTGLSGMAMRALEDHSVDN